jgi:aspartyl-tRNA(Asn)/glutamyl-tRNA(Gln) amidotransferase subunit A
MEYLCILLISAAAAAAAATSISSAYIVPTTIITAPRFDEQTVRIDMNTVVETREALLRNTILFNSIGLPAISIPIGLTKKDNMPVAAQIIGPPFKEETILSIAYNYERTNNSPKRFIPPHI